MSSGLFFCYSLIQDGLIEGGGGGPTPSLHARSFGLAWGRGWGGHCRAMQENSFHFMPAEQTADIHIYIYMFGRRCHHKLNFPAHSTPCGKGRHVVAGRGYHGWDNRKHLADSCRLCYVLCLPHLKHTQHSGQHL